MNWAYVLGLAVGAFALTLITLRAERQRWWVVILLLDLPIAYLSVQWIDWRKAWNEAWVGVILAALAAGIWWLAWGRRLPPVTSDNIKVWGQEAGPRPRPQDVAAMQAEILRLQEEKEKMEAELRRLKGEKKSTD